MTYVHTPLTDSMYMSHFIVNQQGYYWLLVYDSHAVIYGIYLLVYKHLQTTAYTTLL